jgi:hypothetical protein
VRSVSADEERVLLALASELGGLVEDGLGIVVDRTEDVLLWSWEAAARAGALPSAAYRLAGVGRGLCALARMVPTRGGQVVTGVSYLSMRSALGVARGARRTLRSWR